MMVINCYNLFDFKSYLKKQSMRIKLVDQINNVFQPFDLFGKPTVWFVRILSVTLVYCHFKEPLTTM